MIWVFLLAVISPPPDNHIAAVPAPITQEQAELMDPSLVERAGYFSITFKWREKPSQNELRAALADAKPTSLACRVKASGRLDCSTCDQHIGVHSPCDAHVQPLLDRYRVPNSVDGMKSEGHFVQLVLPPSTPTADTTAVLFERVDFTARPTPQQVLAVHPKEGSAWWGVNVHCIVRGDGRLDGCWAANSNYLWPGLWSGISQTLIPAYRVAPVTSGGLRTVGRHVMLRIELGPNGEDHSPERASAHH